jgi:RimJ/RimL family protein N-acetyltransferase
MIAPAAATEERRVLIEGRTIHIRPLRANDGARLVAFHEALSSETVYHRFFSVHPHLSEAEVAHFCQVDGHQRFALAAVDDDLDRIVGVARMERLAPPGTAEVAFVLADDHQHKGLGILMAQMLMHAAAQRGFMHVVAETMSDNDPMIHLLAAAGFVCTLKRQDQLVRIDCDLSGHKDALPTPP